MFLIIGTVLRNKLTIDHFGVLCGTFHQKRQSEGACELDSSTELDTATLTEDDTAIKPDAPTEPAPTCSDGVKNGLETGIDCGGQCGACPACSDGIQNGLETGIDCGATCANVCPTCFDGVQNQGETGIDCGGSCSSCPTCSDGIQNGNEAGVDCGLVCELSCDLLVECSSRRDLQSEFSSDNVRMMTFCRNPTSCNEESTNGTILRQNIFKTVYLLEIIHSINTKDSFPDTTGAEAEYKQLCNTLTQKSNGFKKR